MEKLTIYIDDNVLFEYEFEDRDLLFEVLNSYRSAFERGLHRDDNNIRCEKIYGLAGGSYGSHVYLFHHPDHYVTTISFSYRIDEIFSYDY